MEIVERCHNLPESQAAPKALKLRVPGPSDKPEKEEEDDQSYPLSDLSRNINTLQRPELVTAKTVH